MMKLSRVASLIIINALNDHMDRWWAGHNAIAHSADEPHPDKYTYAQVQSLRETIELLRGVTSEETK